MHINQALILAGGLGTRLGVKSKNCPKPMQNICGIPFLEYLIWNLKRHGIIEIVISVGYLKEKIISYFGDGKRYDVNINYVTEKEPAGTAGAILLSKEILHERFFFLNGDTIFDINFHDLGQFLITNNCIGVMALKPQSNSERYGLVQMNNNDVVSFAEKKSNQSGFTNGGILAFRREVLEYIKYVPSSLEKDIFPELICAKNLKAKKYNSFFIDIGTPDSLSLAKKSLPQWQRKGAVFFDRDGVINEDYGYVCSKDRFKFINGAENAIKMVNSLGLLAIIITNQSGIARNLYSEKEFSEFMNWINNQLKASGAHFDDYYYCPHHPTAGQGIYKEDCNCRKPKSGMISKALSDWNIDKKRSILIGDKDSDILAANKLNIPAYKFDLVKNKLDNFIDKLQIQDL